MLPNFVQNLCINDLHVHTVLCIYTIERVIGARQNKVLGGVRVMRCGCGIYVVRGVTVLL